MSPLADGYERAHAAALELGSASDFRAYFVGALLTGLDDLQDPRVDELVVQAITLAKAFAVPA